MQIGDKWKNECYIACRWCIFASKVVARKLWSFGDRFSRHNYHTRINVPKVTCHNISINIKSLSSKKFPKSFQKWLLSISISSMNTLCSPHFSWNAVISRMASPDTGHGRGRLCTVDHVSLPRVYDIRSWFQGMELEHT